MQAVREVLHEIGAHTRPGIVVLNKSDTIDDSERALLERRYPGAVFVSALDGTGIDELVARIADEAARDSITMSVTIPYTRGDLVQLAHERAHIVTERHVEDGTQLIVRVPKELAERYAQFATEDDAAAEDEANTDSAR